MSSPREYCGLVNLCKPTGMTSRDAVDALQRLLPRPRPKMGHAGTLDPLATGVLVVCLGAATRLVPLLQDQHKSYRATFRLGQTSTTDDVAGDITLVTEKPDISAERLRETLSQFVGQISQVPPRVSAVRVSGRRAYALARQGAEFELSAKTVEVSSIELTAFDGLEFSVEIDCGSGTYVRSIGRDVGERLGCGALMTALERSRVGPFDISSAVDLDSLRREQLPGVLQSPLAAIPHLARLLATEDEIRRIRCGQILTLSCEEVAGNHRDVAVTDSRGQLIAIGAYEAQAFHPRIVFPATVNSGSSG